MGPHPPQIYNLDVKYILGSPNSAAEAFTSLGRKIRLPDDVPTSLAHIKAVIHYQP